MTEGVADASSILKLVNKTMELPTLPEVLVKLHQVIAEPESTTDDVVTVISSDPAVSTNILRIVNSAYHGLQVRISSINLAVSVLGFSMIKKVALKAAVFSVFGRQKENTCDYFDPVGFWKHSIFTGVAAKVLGAESEHFDDRNGEDLYICGLLHDIGKIILLENEEQRFHQVLRQAALGDRPELEVETEVLGFNHADVGSVLAIKWFLPEDLTTAIRYHHVPAADPFQQSLSSLIHLADHVAWDSSYPSTVGVQAPELDARVYDRIGLDPQRVKALLPQIHEGVKHAGMPW